MDRSISVFRITLFLFLSVFLLVSKFVKELESMELADPVPEEEIIREEEIREETIPEPVREDAESWKSSMFIGWSRPNRELLLENAPLNLRVEARLLGREVINFIRWKRPDIAQRKLFSLEKILPESEETYYLRGALHFTYGRWNEAEESLKKAIQIHPRHDPALFLLGCTYAMKRDWMNSLDYLKRSVRQAPYTPYYRMNIAYLHFLLEEYEEAREEIRTILIQKPNSENAIVLARILSLITGQEESAYFPKELKLDQIKLPATEVLESWLQNDLQEEEGRIRFVMDRFYTFYPVLK